MFDFLLSNDLLSTLMAFAIVFIPAVIVHELGHFLAAKAVGITVLEFGIGFPPRVAKLFTWRETEFTLNALPIGGFVRPLGEDMVRPISEEETERERQKYLESQGVAKNDSDAQDRFSTEREELEARGFAETMAVHEAKPWPRILFMSAGAIANFIFALLVFVLIGMIGLPEEVGVRLGFALLPENHPFESIDLQTGDMIETVNGEYFVSTGEFFDIMEANVGEEVTVQIRRTQATPDEIFRASFVVTEEHITFLNSPEPYVLITSVEQDGPGGIAGLLPGDIITAFNGESLTNAANPAESLVVRTDDAAGTEVTLTVLREGETLDISIVPRVDPPPGRGKIGIGISPQWVTPDGEFGYVVGRQLVSVPQPVGESIQYGFERVGSIFGLIAEFPARLAQGNTSPEERRVVSVVGLSRLGGEILQDSIEEDLATPLLEYVALISIALGFTNLLPIPALDGGRILFVVVELIRGKPIPPEREGLVHLVGVIFILSVGVLVIINDLVNPLSDSFLR